MFIGKRTCWEDLDSDVSIEVFIFGLVDFSRASPQLGFQI
jgi:hypothetical protein